MEESWNNATADLSNEVDQPFKEYAKHIGNLS